MNFPGFVDGAYSHPSRKVECQDCVNLFYEPVTTGTQPYGNGILLGTPGLKPYAEVMDKSPWRGLYLASNGRLYGVCGSRIYRISDTGTITDLGVTLNSSTGSVSMADNGTYVVMCHSTESLTASLWSINMSTDAAATINVEANDIYKVFSVSYKTGRFLIAGFYGTGGTSQAQGRVHYSDLNSITFQALSFFTAQASPDPVNQIITSTDYVWLGGERTIEVWQVGTTSSLPFVPLQGGVINIGTVGQTLATADNSILWLGTQGGTVRVFLTQGLQPKQVSTFALESWLGTADLTGCFAYTYSNNGHLFYVLTLPQEKTTWVFDVVTGKWHERKSYSGPLDTDPELSRHRGNVYARAFGKHLVGDYLTGKIFEMRDDIYTEDGVPIYRQRTSPHIAAENKRMFFSKFEVIAQVGVGLDSDAFGSDPVMQMQYSRDAGYTWSSWKDRSMGKIGQYLARVIWRMLGESRDRVFRIRVTHPVPVVILGADVEASGEQSA